MKKELLRTLTDTFEGQRKALAVATGSIQQQRTQAHPMPARLRNSNF